MANTVTLQSIIDGPKTHVVKIYLASDGVAGELTDQVVVNVSALLPAATKVSLERVQWSLNGFDALLEWDATTDVAIFTLGANASTSDLDFSKYGGIPNNAGTGVTGNILLTTVGFTTTADTGIIILTCRKNT